MKNPIIAAFALILSLLLAPSAEAAILAQGSSVAGKTIGAWTQDWWAWALSLAVPNDPLSDQTGANANNNQSGPVFFIGGTAGGTANRSFTVPQSRYLLLPLVNTVWTEADYQDPNDIQAAAEGAINAVNSLFFSLDGVPVPQAALFGYREPSSDFFSMIVVPDSVFDTTQLGGVPAGTYNHAYSDGYWLMLEPLSVGPHTIFFGGGISGVFSVEVTDNIRVPEPSSLAMMALGMGLLARRRFYGVAR